ncbi:response regulator transcription factor [Carboxylicivirga mesophila]|uniref:Response regulator transcription factor n=1 Tax=Carboxylicivirga mesophila TaxID=1166478 RepID=A0ABS5K8F3_9BACT|nr:LytTR family DNA-binding domain-containing protein [Carboxylicivirga mesophila]MBS2211249.1 response regulator transcription factor [Carboxylicivirga mesophila]
MRILIVEDEHLAASRLSQMIQKLHPDAEISSICDSVELSVDWLKNNPQPDLAFFDIQLGDGISFDIFEQCDVMFPVIFTTAYDQYAIKAFKVNSIDYLLKPIEEEALETAINKFLNHQNMDLTSIHQAILQTQTLIQQNNYKTRFLIKVGEHLRMINTNEISFFYSEEKDTFLRTLDGHSYALDQSLDRYEIQLNPADFYRISRKYIVRISAIADIINYSNSRLKLKLIGMQASDDVIVSRERVKAFKYWLEETAG